MITNQDKYGGVANWTKANGQSDLRGFVYYTIVEALLGKYGTVTEQQVWKRIMVSILLRKYVTRTWQLQGRLLSNAKAGGTNHLTLCIKVVDCLHGVQGRLTKVWNKSLDVSMNLALASDANNIDVRVKLE